MEEIPALTGFVNGKISQVSISIVFYNMDVLHFIKNSRSNTLKKAEPNH
jgi:hypothetical protein